MAQYNAFPPNLPTPRIKTFNDAYKARFGEESHGFAAQSYDGLHVAVEAMAKAGTISDGKAIRDALAGAFDRRRHRSDQVRRQGPGVAAGLHHPMVRQRHAQGRVTPISTRRTAAVADRPRRYASIARGRRHADRAVRADRQRHDDRQHLCAGRARHGADLRRHAGAELRPWRAVHGRRLSSATLRSSS